MKRITLVSLTVCLILVIVSGISVSTLAEITSETMTKAEQRFEKANELLNRKEYKAAIAEFEEVMNISPNSKIAQDAQYWMGQSHFMAGQFDAAQATFAKLIEQYPASAIVPVTKLMVGRVEQAKENEEIRRTMSNTVDKGFIIDPDTGVRYTKTAAFVGKNDVIEYNYGYNILVLSLSPNGKFLLSNEKLVVPLDGSEPFELVDIPAAKCTWSPDGKNVAFISGDAICMVPVSPETGRPTGPVRKLLDWRNKSTLSWSPDGEKLAFTSAFDKDKGIYGGDVWTLSVKDGSLTQITSDRDVMEGVPAWSPDGRTIAYLMKKDRLKERYTLCLISAEGGVPREIIERRGRYFPSWSPDGKWILYKEWGIIYLLSLADKQELEIIPPRAVGDFFSWSPDGKKMLFYRTSYGYKYDIKVVSTSGGPPFDLGRQVTLYPGHSWSPDSKMIVSGGKNEAGRYGLWVSPLSGGEPAPLEMDVSANGKTRPFAVSPDAKKLASVVGRDDGTEDLFVVPVSLQEARTTGPAIKVFDGWSRAGFGDNITASWSPDGNKLAVSHRGDVWIAFSNGDKPVQITKTPGLKLYPASSKSAWSPDGKMVRYTIKGQGLYVVPASGGKATKIFVAGSRNSVWSPDSKGLTIVSNGWISTVPIVGGQTQQIAELKDLPLKSVYCLRWSPDGKSIACVGNQAESWSYRSSPIFVIPAEGGKATTLVTNDTSYKYWLHWSPDGRWISYNSEGPVKVRPEGTMWEVDFEEIVKKASR